MAGISSASSLPWLWIIEYLSDFKRIDTSILNDLISRAPEFSGPSGQSARERCALRCLSELVDSRDFEEASSESRLRFNLSNSCEDVFLLITDEVGTSNKRKDGLGVRKSDIQAFIEHKRATLPRCSLMKLKDSIFNGSDPLTSKKNDKELFRILCDDDSSPVMSIHQKSNENVQETVVKKVLTSPISGGRNGNLLMERDIISGKRNRDEKGGDPLDESSDKECGVKDKGDECSFCKKSMLNISILGTSEKEATFENEPREPSHKCIQQYVRSEGCIADKELSRCGIQLGTSPQVHCNDTVVPDSLDVNNQSVFQHHDDEVNRNVCINDNGFQVRVDVQLSNCLNEARKNVYGNGEVQPDLTEDYASHHHIKESSNARPDNAFVDETVRDKPECDVNNLVTVEREASKSNGTQARTQDVLSDDGISFEDRYNIQHKISNGLQLNESINLGVSRSGNNGACMNGEVFKDSRADPSKENAAANTDKCDFLNSKPDSVDTIESSELNFCMKCNRGGQLLTCSNSSCVLMVHKKCLDSSTCLDNEHFYCPFCAYSRAISDYLEAKKKVSLARKKLSAFVGSGIEHRKRKSSKDKQIKAPNRLKQNDNIEEGDHNAVDESVAEDSTDELAATVGKEHGCEQEVRKVRKRAKTNANRSTNHQKVDESGQQLVLLSGSDTHHHHHHHHLQAPSKIGIAVTSEDVTTTRKTRKQKFQMPQHPAFTQLRRNIMAWTAAEEQILKEGVHKFSKENSRGIPWKKILEFGSLVFLRNRTTIDLKDKWRNMCKATSKP